jgi:hypothetical protein
MSDGKKLAEMLTDAQLEAARVALQIELFGRPVRKKPSAPSAPAVC